MTIRGAIEIFAALVAIAVLEPAFAASVYVGNREWRDPIETTGISYLRAQENCDLTSGRCVGDITPSPNYNYADYQVSLGGWTWATKSEVIELFEQLIFPLTTEFPAGTTSYDAPQGSDVIDRLIGAGYFTSGASLTDREVVWGITRTYSETWWEYGVQVGVLMNAYSSLDGSSNGFAYMTATLQNADLGGGGLWLYRDAIKVPEPGTVALLSLGLAALGLSQRRKANGYLQGSANRRGRGSLTP